MRIWFVMAFCLISFVPSANARGGFAKECGVSMPCIGVESTDRPQSSRRHGHGSISLSGVVAPLASKIRSIQAACPGTKILSTLRQTRRPGGSWSMHASGRAVDVRGNYRCIYQQLAGWAAYSTDAVRCRHIHISYGGDEGRFRHRYC